MPLSDGKQFLVAVVVFFQFFVGKCRVGTCIEPIATIFGRNEVTAVFLHTAVDFCHIKYRQCGLVDQFTVDPVVDVAAHIFNAVGFAHAGRHIGYDVASAEGGFADTGHRFLLRGLFSGSVVAGGKQQCGYKGCGYSDLHNIEKAPPMEAGLMCYLTSLSTFLFTFTLYFL